MTKTFEDIYLEQQRCLCGHVFKIVDLAPEQLRYAGGKWLNKSVEHSSPSGHIECQCPKCLLWFNTMTNDI